jgi:glycosyltransferase 2 family protein
MKLGWRSVLGIAVSVLLLYFLFSKISLSEVRANLRQADLGLLALTAVVSTLIFPLRARRWRTILDPVAPHVPLGKLWRATAIGMMMNNVLWARAGEPGRAFALSREAPEVPFSTAFASLAVDRLFDAIVLLLLLALAMLDPSFPSGVAVGGKPLASYAIGFLGVILVGLIGLYALVFFPTALIRGFELIARRVAPRLEARGRDALAAFTQGLSVLKSPKHFLAISGWTVLHWLVNGLAFWICFRAVHVPGSFAAALFAQGVIAVGVAAPSSPGFVGVFEAGAVVALGVYGIDRASALSWAFAFHIVSYIPITLIGAYYFARLGMSLGELKALEKKEPAASATA